MAQAAHAVRPVARIAHRQQIAVFGVKQKQQPVQQHQRGFTHLVQIIQRELRSLESSFADFVRGGAPIAPRQRVSQLRKHLVKNALAQILRHLFFIQPRLVQRVGVKTAARLVPVLRQKRTAAEKHIKQAQRMIGRNIVNVVLNAGQLQRGGQIQLKKFFRT